MSVAERSDLSEISLYGWLQRYKTAAASVRLSVNLRYPMAASVDTLAMSTAAERAVVGTTRVAPVIVKPLSPQAPSLHATRLPLATWFRAIYWRATGKGSIPAPCLRKRICVNWRSALRLGKLCTAMGHQEAIWLRTRIIELHDLFIAGRSDRENAAGVLRARLRRSTPATILRQSLLLWP